MNTGVSPCWSSAGVRPVVGLSVGSLPRAVRAMTTMGDHELRQAVPRRLGQGDSPGAGWPRTAPSMSEPPMASAPWGPTRPARPRRRWSSSPSATRSSRARSTCSSSAWPRGAGARGGDLVGEGAARAGRATPTRSVTSSSLAARLDALAPVIAVQRSARKEERAQKSAESKAAKEKLVAEAETARRRAPTGATAPTGCASCWRRGRSSPGSTAPPTTPCGAASPPRGRRTPATARRTSPRSTSAATPRASSRSGWPRRPRRSRPRPSGARLPASTAT